MNGLKDLAFHRDIIVYCEIHVQYWWWRYLYCNRS